MKAAEKEQYENEQLAGDKAERAYSSFVGPFIEQKRQALFQAFCDLPITEDENLMGVKRMLYAIDTLNDEIKTVIETGKMAGISLNKAEEQENE